MTTQFQLRYIIPGRKSTSNSPTEHVFSSRFPRFLSASKNLLVDHATATNAICSTFHTPSNVDKLVYVGNPPTVLAFLEDGQVAVYRDTPTGLQFIRQRPVANDNRSVTLAHAAQFGNFAVFCKADSPSVWCLPVSDDAGNASLSTPFKLRSDLGGDQQKASVIDGTLAKLRNKVTTNAKVKLSPVIALASHPNQPLVAAAYANGIIRVWDIDRRDQRTHLDTQLFMAESIVSIAFHPSFNVLVACTTHGRIISFFISSNIYKYGDNPDLATSKTRDRKRRFRAMTFTHSNPPHLILLTASKRLIVRLINRKGIILGSARFPKASRPLHVQDGAVIQTPSVPGMEEFEQQDVNAADFFPASITSDPIFGMIACSLDKSGSLYIFQPSIERLPVLHTPISSGTDYGLSTVPNDQFLGDIDVYAESLFVYRNTLFSYTLGTEVVAKLCRLPVGEVRSINVARDEHGYCIAALVFYHGDDILEPTDYAETQEVMRYVLCTKRGEGDYWNVSQSMEGRSGCFLNPSGMHDRILIISPAGTTISVSSFVSKASSTSPRKAFRGVQRFKLISGRVGRVFPAPFAEWSAVVYHDIREKRIAVSKNTFESSEMNYNQQAGGAQDFAASYSMDDSTALNLYGNEIVLDVRWQHFSRYSKRDDDYLGVILTDKRIYFVRDVLQPLSTFDFDSISRIIIPFAPPTICWAGPSVMLMHGNTFLSVSVNGEYEVVAGLSHGECATAIVVCLPSRISYAAPSFNGKIGSVSVRTKSFGGLSPVTTGILSLPHERNADKRLFAPLMNHVFERHDVSQGSDKLADALKSKGLPAIAYLMAVSKQGKHSFTPVSRAVFLANMGDIRGALNVAENEYTKLENVYAFHDGTELYRLLQRILNMAFIIGDFEVCRRCSQLLGRRGTLSAFVESEGGFDALRAVMDAVRRSNNQVVMNKLRLLFERSGNSSIASQLGIMPSRQQVQALRQAISSGVANPATFGSKDVRNVFIKVVVSGSGDSGGNQSNAKGKPMVVNRMKLEMKPIESVNDRLEIMRNESIAFEADISGPADEYAEFIEDGPRPEVAVPMVTGVDDLGSGEGASGSRRTSGRGRGNDATQPADSSDDENDGDDSFGILPMANKTSGDAQDKSKSEIEGLLPTAQGQLSHATMTGAADTEVKLERQRAESRATVEQMSQSAKALAIAQRQVQPSGDAIPEAKAQKLVSCASEKLREGRIKSAQKDIENGIRALARGLERGVMVSQKVLTESVHYRFACKLYIAMNEIADSEHVNTVPGRMTYVQFATACSSLSLRPVDQADALVKVVDANLALGNFGVAAQALRLIKQVGVPEGMREDLRKRYQACQVRGFSNAVAVPGRMICYASLKSFMPGVPMFGCSTCVAIYSVDSGVAVGYKCEYCQMGKIVVKTYHRSFQM